MNKVGHKLIAWYHKQNFDMPWRDTKDVYKIWISEIMLQQTQVKTVIKYYNNWVKSFPTINLLDAPPIFILLFMTPINISLSSSLSVNIL